MVRSFMFAMTVVLLAAAVAAESQQGARVHRIGVLAVSSEQPSAPPIEAFRAGLRDLEYTERRLTIEWRWAQGKTERLPQLAAELVNMKVDLIVAGGNEGTVAAMNATATIPVVMWGSSDPVAAGLVKSLARPGGNVTGTAHNTPEVAGKILAVLKEAVPKAAAVAVLLDRSMPRMDAHEAEAQAVASRLGITLDLLDVKSPGDLRAMPAKAGRAHPSALYVVTTPAVRQALPEIIQLAAANRIPAIYTSTEAVHVGGLMSYSASFVEIARRVAWYVDRILMGAKPVDLPVEQPTRFELVINRKTATTLGYSLPPSLLLRVDRVVEQPV